MMPTVATKVERLESSVKTAQDRLKRAKAELARRSARLSAERRRRETRWKILVGGTVLARARADTGYRDELDVLLEDSLRADRDRALLDAWRQGDAAKPPAVKHDDYPLQGSPMRLEDGTWGAAVSGSAVLRATADLKGRSVKVTPQRGRPWVAKVTEVVSRTSGHILVRHTGRP